MVTTPSIQSVDGIPASTVTGIPVTLDQHATLRRGRPDRSQAQVPEVQRADGDDEVLEADVAPLYREGGRPGALDVVLHHVRQGRAPE
jgi:hypothetical protein